MQGYIHTVKWRKQKLEKTTQVILKEKEIEEKCESYFNKNIPLSTIKDIDCKKYYKEKLY